MIHVIALITAPAGQRSTILDAFNAVAPTLRAGEGCIEYVATVDAKGLPPSENQVGSDIFVAVEKWISLQTLGAHSVTPHVQVFTVRITGLGAPLKIHVLEPVEVAYPHDGSLGQV